MAQLTKILEWFVEHSELLEALRTNRVNPMLYFFVLISDVGKLCFHDLQPHSTMQNGSGQRE